jgi:hypothetical protein
MVEVLTPAMQREYLRTVTVAGWKRVLEAVPVAHAA